MVVHSPQALTLQFPLVAAVPHPLHVLHLKIQDEANLAI